MNGEHLGIRTWQDHYKVNTVDAIRYGHLPGAPCRECKWLWRAVVMGKRVVDGLCTRCGIKWPLEGNKVRRTR